jgi:hypothetical protein
MALALEEAVTDNQGGTMERNTIDHTGVLGYRGRTQIESCPSVTLDEELVRRLVEKLRHTTDQGPRGKNWQSDDLQKLIDQLEYVLREPNASDRGVS